MQVLSMSTLHSNRFFILPDNSSTEGRKKRKPETIHSDTNMILACSSRLQYGKSPRRCPILPSVRFHSISRPYDEQRAR